MTIAETSYVVTMMIVKISLAIFFARIVIKPWHVNLIKLALCISITSSVSAFFYSIFRCGPNLDDYAMRQILQQCSNLPLDLFMAYQQGILSTDRLVLCTRLTCFVSCVQHPHRFDLYCHARPCPVEFSNEATNKNTHLRYLVDSHTVRSRTLTRRPMANMHQRHNLLHDTLQIRQRYP